MLQRQIYLPILPSAATDAKRQKQGSYLQGVRETKQEDILGMHQEGLSAEAIARVVKYSIEDVQKILNEADSK